jgi:hypothetical protein
VRYWEADVSYVLRQGRLIEVETLFDPAWLDKPKRKRADAFVMVPLVWAERLETTRNATTIKVALRLLYLVWKNKGQPIALSNMAVARFADRRRKWRALRELERLGLIKVERRAGSSPMIVVVTAKT